MKLKKKQKKVKRMKGGKKEGMTKTKHIHTDRQRETPTNPHTHTHTFTHSVALCAVCSALCVIMIVHVPYSNALPSLTSY